MQIFLRYGKDHTEITEKNMLSDYVSIFSTIYGRKIFYTPLK